MQQTLAKKVLDLPGRSDRDARADGRGTLAGPGLAGGVSYSERSNRTLSKSALTVGRGNGKTTLTAGIATAALDGPLAVDRGEVVIVASSFEQARIGFGHVLAFLRAKYGDALEDRRLWRVQDSANKAQITNRSNGALLKCVGSDPRRMHGLAPALLLADEGAQWEPGTAEAAMAALRTALGKIPDSRLDCAWDSTGGR